MSALIGALRVSLSADTAKFEEGMKRAQRQAHTSASSISKSMGMLKAGIVGLASGLSIGMLAGAIKGALDYAGSLGEVAAQLGVTTKELQVFRFAAGQMGVKQEEADKGLQKLTLSLSKAASGSKPTIAAFNSVGVSLDDIKKKGAVEIFGQMGDSMKKTGGASANAAAGVALMSRNFQKFVPLLDTGSAGMNQLSAAAEKLGIVLSDQQIQQADDTADKLDALKTVLMANIAGAVANNANAIIGLANSLVMLVSQIGNAIMAWRNFNAEFQGDMAELRGDEANAARYRGQAYVSGKNPTRAGRSVTVKLGAPKSISTGSGINRSGVPQFLKGGGGAKKAKGAKGPADTSLRDAHQFDMELRRAQMDVLRATQSLAVNFVQQNIIAVQILDAEKAAFEAEMIYAVAAKERTVPQAQALRLEYDKKDALERQKILAEDASEAMQASAQLDQVTFELDRDLLQSQQVLAETASEQRDIQLRLLDLFYRQETAKLEAVLADEQSSDLAKEEARRRLQGLGETRAAATEEVIRGTRGPWEEYAASIPNTADKMQEALERVRVDGVESLTGALVDTITGVKSLGDAFSAVAKQIVADLMTIYIRKMLVGALGSALGGGFGSIFSGSSVSTGSVSGSGILPPIPGMATGGSFSVLGRGGTDRNVLSINGLPIARVSHGERVNIANDNVNGSGRVTVVPSKYFDVHVQGMALAVASPLAGQAAIAGAAGAGQRSANQAKRQIP